MRCCNIHSKLLGSHYLVEVATGKANMFRTMLLVVYRGYGHAIAPADGNPDSPPEAMSGFDKDRVSA